MAIEFYKSASTIEFVGNDPNCNYLATAFAGINNDVVFNGIPLTSLQINAVPSANPTGSAVFLDETILTVNIGSPGGNVAGTMTASELIDLGEDLIVLANGQLAPKARIASDNTGFGNIVPGTYAATLAPVAGFVGQLCKARNAIWQRIEDRWIPIKTLEGELVTFSIDQNSFFSLGVNGDSASTNTLFIP